MAFLLKLHGEIRWLVVLVGAIALVRYAVGWARRGPYTGLDRGLLAAFTGLLDLNFALGLVLLFTLGLLPYRLEHAVTMLSAIVIAHLAALWRRSEDSARKFRNNLIVLVLALALIVVGVVRLRGGWLF